MNRFILVSLCLGIALIACGKRESQTIAQPDDSAATPRVRPRGHASREAVPGSPARLRADLTEAEIIGPAVDREKAIAEVAWSALETDPALSEEAFLKLPRDRPERLRLIEHHAMRVAERDPEEALAWADGLESEQETAAAKGMIALVLAETDPLGAANLLSESGIAGRDFDVALVQVIQRWAGKSPSDAAAWVATFPPGPAREPGIGVIAGSWLPRDPEATFAWFGGLRDPVVRQEAAQALQGIILQQPEDVRMAWLEHADAGLRDELERQSGQALLDVGDNIPQPLE